MTARVFQLWSSVEEDRPDLVTNKSSDFDEASKINRGLIRNKRHDVDSWTPWQLYCSKRGTTPVSDWDYYDVGSTSGCFSRRAIETLGNNLSRCFDLLPANLEGETFYFLHCRAPIDCLDISASEVVYFPAPYDNDIMHIRRYVFKKDIINEEVIFTIPEQPWCLFTTAGIPSIASQAGLTGIDFRLLDDSN